MSVRHAWDEEKCKAGDYHPTSSRVRRNGGARPCSSEYVCRCLTSVFVAFQCVAFRRALVFEVEVKRIKSSKDDKTAAEEEV